MTMDNEKRRYIRFPYKMKTELIVRNKRYESDEIINLSIGGCLLPINADLESGSPCTLRIILQQTGNEPTVTVEGSIVRSDKGSVAVKFVSIDPENLDHLQNIARYNSPDPDQVEKEIDLNVLAAPFSPGIEYLSLFPLSSLICQFHSRGNLSTPHVEFKPNP